MFVCMYVLACMLCLIWGCDALVLRRQEALVGPLMGIELSHHRGMLQGTFLLDAPHATHSHTHTRKVTNIYSAVKKNHKQNTGRRHLVHVRFTQSSRVWRECKYRGRITADCIYCCDVGFLEAPGLSEGPGVLRLSFVKEPRGPRRGWLEHTWQFEPLGRSAGITPNWLWRLAVSPKLKMVCCCALCIGRGFGSHRGRKGFFRNQWGGW